jgi:tellurium resistance protein TerZ
MNLTKSTGINLTKGSSISLAKDGNGLTEITIGLNWGAIKSNSFFGLVSNTQAVDLDGTVALFDNEGTLVDTVYYHHLVSGDGSIKHSGDDREGDTFGPDDIDNEIIHINLHKVAQKVKSIVVFLNSYKGQDFDSIPYSKIRIYEGNPKALKATFATFNLSKESAFINKVSMVMGKVIRDDNNKWHFKTIGEPLDAKNIDSSIQEIRKKYLQVA